MAVDLVPPIPTCVECKHHRGDRTGRHMCWRGVQKDFDVVLGQYIVNQATLKDCYAERTATFDENKCMKTARFFEGLPG